MLAFSLYVAIQSHKLTHDAYNTEWIHRIHWTSREIRRLQII